MSVEALVQKNHVNQSIVHSQRLVSSEDLHKKVANVDRMDIPTLKTQEERVLVIWGF